MEENNQNASFQKEAENTAPAPAPETIIIETPQSLEKETGGFSLKKWGTAGILIAVLNPVFAGLIFGAILLTEPKMRKLGAIVALVSIVWGAISYFLLDKYWSVNFLGI